MNCYCYIYFQTSSIEKNVKKVIRKSFSKNINFINYNFSFNNYLKIEPKIVQSKNEIENCKKSEIKKYLQLY